MESSELAKNLEDICHGKLGRDSDSRVAGETDLDFLTDYFHITDDLNVHRLFSMLATEVVDSPEEADVVVSVGENAFHGFPGMIQEDNVSVMDYLTCQSPENLRKLLRIAEKVNAQQVTKLLQEKLV